MAPWTGLARKLRDPFSPSWLTIAVNPFWLTRRALYQSISKLGPLLQGRVLDFGCGTAPYRPLLSSCQDYIGLEYDSPRSRAQAKADIYYDGSRIPLEDGVVDAVLCTESLEHVPDPTLIVREWSRVLKGEGLLLITVPLLWPEHEVPWDFHRFTTYGLRQLLEQNNFDVLSIDRLLPDCRAPAQLFLAWVHDTWLAGRARMTKRLLIALICPTVALSATILARLSPKGSNTYVNNVMFARRRSQ